MTDVIFELPRDAAEALCSSTNAMRPSSGLIIFFQRLTLSPCN